MTIRYRQPVEPNRFLDPIYRSLEIMHCRYWNSQTKVTWCPQHNYWQIRLTLGLPSDCDYEWNLYPDTDRAHKLSVDMLNEMAVAEIMDDIKVKPLRW